MIGVLYIYIMIHIYIDCT